MEELQKQLEKFLESQFEWVDDVEDGKYFYMERSKGTILTNPFVKSIMEIVHSAYTKGEDAGWTKGWLNGVEAGMNYFDTTKVSGTKVPGTDLTIKQKIDDLKIRSGFSHKE